ncbi:MAG: SAM-dependent methyltransferase [Bacteroidetes bacterium]|nr:SAM-dependent methyltransferase [Bacteroidota bacterium]HET6243029.1 SAM-dependent methyltransferase [Bacteroidia bacterium]
MEKGKIYLIPTTLGENAQIEYAIPAFVSEIVNSIEHYIVENEKTARHYLKKLKIEKPLQELKLYPLNKFTPVEDIPGYLSPALDGKPMGIISEAGCPGIADPGADIVKLAHEQGLKVVPLVGPSSILLALIASGLNGQNFAFHGYLPIEARERVRKLKELENYSRQHNQTQIFIETPYRNDKLYADIIATCNSETLLCIATDITLRSEQISTHSIDYWKKKKPVLNKRPAVFLIHSGF